MSEHFQRSITEAMAWCKTCNRQTQHRVFDRRLAHCLEHGPKVDANGLNKQQAKRRAEATKEKQNPSLFE